MEDIFLKIKEMGILLALGSLLQHLLPSQEYGRYVRLLTITILIAYFAMPLCRMFGGDGFEKFWTKLLIHPEEYANDISLKGEFVRRVTASNLKEAEKERVIACGFRALTGEEIGF